MTLVVAALMALVVATPAFAQTVATGAGGNGSITITNAEKDATYGVYKILDATVATDGSIAYKLPSGVSLDTGVSWTDDTTDPATSGTAKGSDWFEVKNGNVFAKDTLTSDVLKSAAFKAWAKSVGTQVGASATASESTVAFTELPFGYYYVESSLGAVLTIDSTNPSAQVVDKNQIPSFDKNIVDDPENPVKVNEAGLNEEVDFDITVTAKNYDGDEKIFKYVIYDTMDPGFSLTGAPVVKIDGVTPASNAYTITYKKGNAETTTVTEADYFEITIPWTSDGTKNTAHLYDANAVLNVTYTAKLDPAKAASVTTGATPNKNKADVKYFKGNDTSTTPSGDLPDVETETYDTQVTITKVDGNNAALTGAQFTLTTTNGTKVVYTTENKYEEDAAGTYYKLKDGTYTSEAPNGNADHDAAYDSTTTKYKLTTEDKVMGEGQTPSSVAAYVGADGKLTFTGLGVGTYTIEETVVPAGYNKVDNLTFTISFDADKESATYKKFASDNNKVVLNATNNVFDTTIVNNKGTELPSTGGMGTTILYVVGGVMVAGAAVYLLTKKRASSMQ